MNSEASTNDDMSSQRIRKAPDYRACAERAADCRKNPPNAKRAWSAADATDMRLKYRGSRAKTTRSEGFRISMVDCLVE